MKTRLVSFLFVLLLASCSKPVVYEQIEYFDDLVWNRFNFIEQEFEIHNTEQLYDLNVLFLHTEFYETDHIAMNITLYYPGGGFRSKDYEFRLQDEHMQWKVQPENKIYTHPFTVLSGLRFSEAGTHRVRIENKMTKFNLTDVVGLGLVIQKSAIKD